MIFNAVNTKIHGMRNRLFKREDYEALYRLGSVERIGAYLRESASYGETMAGLGDVALHRAVLEQRLVLAMSEAYEHISAFVYDYRMREFLSAVYMQYELNIIKILLCGIFDERVVTYTVPELDMLIGKKLHIDVARLMTSETVSAFIENLKGTGFYSMLADTYADKQSMFEIETQLDLYYYMHLWKTMEKLPDKQDRQVMTYIKGTETDLRNIMWIYRLKHYYRVTDARLYAYLIPINYRLKTAAINRLAACNDAAAMTAELAGGPYGALFPDFSDLEYKYERAMRKVHMEAAKRHPNTLAFALAYLFDKELEIYNITRLLECVRYALPMETVLAYMNYA